MLREISQANLDLGFFQGAKIVYGVYTRGSSGYSVIFTDVSIQHRRVVVVFYQVSSRFVVEEIQKFW